MSGSEVSAVHRALNNLFTTLTPEQLQNFVEEMNRPALGAINAIPAVTAPPALSIAHPPIAPAANAPNVNMTITTPTKRATMTRTPPRKRSRENGKLRPLNSFIAFRSMYLSNHPFLIQSAYNTAGFYSASFPDLSQKVKSGLLRLLWRSDPLKAKWAILAKAYSIIRDKHIGQVTLESFLALNGPFVGIFSPSSYIQTMGLQLVADENKQLSLVKTTNPTFNQADLTTNLSVDDVVRNCYQAGYVTGEFSEGDSSLQSIGVAMAVSAQPSYFQTTAPAITRPEIAAPPAMSSNIMFNPASETEENVEMESHVPEDGQVIDTELGSEMAETGEPVMGNTTVPTPISPNRDDSHPRPNVPYTAAEFETELRRAIDSYEFDTTDGYYGLFNPALRHPVAVYNPYRVQGEFDAFDLGEYVNM